MDILKDIKVGVLGGGVSSEREISLLSATEAYKVFRQNNTDTVFIDITASQEEIVKQMILSSNIDLHLSLCTESSEKTARCKTEEIGIPYTLRRRRKLSGNG